MNGTTNSASAVALTTLCQWLGRARKAVLPFVLTVQAPQRQGGLRSPGENDNGPARGRRHGHSRTQNQDAATPNSCIRQAAHSRHGATAASSTGRRRGKQGTQGEKGCAEQFARHLARGNARIGRTRPNRVGPTTGLGRTDNTVFSQPARCRRSLHAMRRKPPVCRGLRRRRPLTVWMAQRRFVGSGTDLFALHTYRNIG